MAKPYSSNHEAPNFNVPFTGPNKKNGDWTETVQGEEVKVRIKGGRRSSD